MFGNKYLDDVFFCVFDLVDSDLRFVDFLGLFYKISKCHAIVISVPGPADELTWACISW